jgi:hypothetical protein
MNRDARIFNPDETCIPFLLSAAFFRTNFAINHVFKFRVPDHCLGVVQYLVIHRDTLQAKLVSHVRFTKQFNDFFVPDFGIRYYGPLTQVGEFSTTGVNINSLAIATTEVRTKLNLVLDDGAWAVDVRGAVARPFVMYLTGFVFPREYNV